VWDATCRVENNRGAGRGITVGPLGHALLEAPGNGLADGLHCTQPVLFRSPLSSLLLRESCNLLRESRLDQPLPMPSIPSHSARSVTPPRSERRTLLSPANFWAPDRRCNPRDSLPHLPARASTAEQPRGPRQQKPAIHVRIQPTQPPLSRGAVAPPRQSWPRGKSQAPPKNEKRRAACAKNGGRTQGRCGRRRRPKAARQTPRVSPDRTGRAGLVADQRGGSMISTRISDQPTS
jgi:hypothetical protein